MQAIVSTPLALSSSAFSTNPGRCFWEQVGVKAPGTASRTTFFPLVKSETVIVWSSPSLSKYERVASGSFSPTDILALIVSKVLGLAERTEKFCLGFKGMGFRPRPP
eukprot:Gb_33383 [translate_table: standard]